MRYIKHQGGPSSNFPFDRLESYMKRVSILYNDGNLKRKTLLNTNNLCLVRNHFGLSRQTMLRSG